MGTARTLVVDSIDGAVVQGCRCGRAVGRQLRHPREVARSFGSAAGVARDVVRGAEELVEVEVSRVTRRYGARWYPFR